MSRKPTGKPSGRPKSRELLESQQRRVMIAMFYWMLRNEGMNPSSAYLALGGKSAVQKACSEFRHDTAVQRIRNTRTTRAQFKDRLNRMTAEAEVDEKIAHWRQVEAVLHAFREAHPRPTVLGLSVLPKTS